MSSRVLYVPPDLPPHCVPDTPVLVYFSQTFGTCLPSYLALASTAAGLLSITSWLFAQMPQIWKNYSRGSVDGLSLGFLAIWLAGDVCNLLGAIWTGQMWFQQAVAQYYVFVDVILVAQYLYFSYIKAPTVLVGHCAHYDESIDDDDDSDDSYLVDSEPETTRKKRARQPARSRSLASTLIVVVSMMFHLAGASPVGNTIAAPPAESGFTLEYLGQVLSWFSTLLYLTSRLPQLLLNFRRRSTGGLAISLFIAAFCGNFFYSLSLLLNPLGHSDYPPYGGGGIAGPDGSDHLEWWGRTLPFFLGAAGVLGLDAAVGWQWLVWGERTEEEEYEYEDDDDIEEEECFGAHSSTWNRWWPWNGWFGDNEVYGSEAATEEVKPLVDDRTVAHYGTPSGSGL